MTVALDCNNPGGMNDGAWAKRQPGYAGTNGRYAAFRTLTDGVNAMAASGDMGLGRALIQLATVKGIGE